MITLDILDDQGQQVEGVSGPSGHPRPVCLDGGDHDGGDGTVRTLRATRMYREMHMAKIDKLLGQAQQHLDQGERIEAAVLGTYETKIMGQDSIRAGILMATDRRLVFYAKKLGGYELESFPYQNISSFEGGKNMMGRYFRFAASGNDVTLKWINAGDIAQFEQLVRSRVGARPQAAAPAPAQPAGSVADELQKLAGLMQQGLISQQEFEAQKARLLGAGS